MALSGHYRITHALLMPQTSFRFIALCCFYTLASCSVSNIRNSQSHTDTYEGAHSNSSPDTTSINSQPADKLGKQLIESALELNTSARLLDQIELQALFSESVTQAENTLGTDLSDVKLVVDDRAEHRKVIARQVQKTQHLLPDKTNQLGLVSSAQAVYDPDTDSIFFHPDIQRHFPSTVGKSRKLAKEYLRFVMLHELVHASDARYGRLNLEWPTIRALTNAALVREGHAHYWSSEMCRQQGCSSFIRKRSQQLKNQQNRSIPEDQITGFYEVGKRFIEGLLLKDPGGGLIDTAFRHPPSNEYQILFPEFFPDKTSDLKNQRIANAVLEADLPWNNSDYKALTIGTIDTKDFQRTASRKTQKYLKQLANITVADGAISFVKSGSRKQQNLSVQVLETDTEASAENAYRAIMTLHDTARGIGAQYGITPQPWKTNKASGEIIVNNQKFKARFFTGTNGRSLNAESSTLHSVDIAVALADRYVVRILNINDTHHDLPKASESILSNLLTKP